jgi:hypothetical protein
VGGPPIIWPVSKPVPCVNAGWVHAPPTPRALRQ